jgi:hypothetical protein
MKQKTATLLNPMAVFFRLMICVACEAAFAGKSNRRTAAPTVICGVLMFPERR